MRFAVLTAFLLTGIANAADSPIVRVEVQPEAVIVGESVRVRVTVLGPTWFPKPPKYPSFEVTNAVVRLPADSSFPVSERIEGDTWSGIVRNYEAIPLIGGNYQLDNLVIQVTYADPETIKPIVVNVPVPSIAFQAAVPAGAEALDPYIAGTGLEIRRELDGETGDLEVGDALIATYVAELEGLPSMFIPELLQSVDTPGVSVYREEPEYSDDPTATRSEKLTFVFEAGGGFEIPAVELDWWNTETATIETASLPAITVNVTGPPVAAAPVVAKKRELHPLRIVTVALLLVLAAWMLRRIVRVVIARRAEKKKQVLASEPHAYAELQQALAAGDARLSYTRLLEWGGRLGGEQDIASFVANYGDDALRQGIGDLRASLYSKAGTGADLRALAASLANARKACHRAENQAEGALLPGLNP